MTTTTETPTHEHAPTRGTRRWVWLAVAMGALLLIVLPLMTVGGDGKTEFREEVTTQARVMEQRFSRLEDAGLGTDVTDPDSVRALSQLARQERADLVGEIARFEQLDPPPEWRDATAYMLEAMHFTESSLAAMRDATSSGQVELALIEQATNMQVSANVNIDLARGAMPTEQ